MTLPTTAGARTAELFPLLQELRDYFIPRAKFINGDPDKKNVEHVLLDKIEAVIDRSALDTPVGDALQHREGV